jgi:peptidoglycan/LPS O-acetylase OafA/YrhL
MKKANGLSALLASPIAGMINLFHKPETKKGVRQGLESQRNFFPRFPEVNCLRGVAILAVVFTHLFPSVKESIPAVFPAGWAAELSGRTALFPLGSFFTNARLGVNLFFVLSGFVLYLPYVLHSRPMVSFADGLKFYKHRFLRLMPLFLINAVIAGLLFYYLHPVRTSFLIKQWLLVVSCFSAFYNIQPVFNFGLWTLVIEIWFSILLVPLYFLIQRYGLVKVTITVFILALTTRIIGPHICPYPYTNPYFHPINDSIFGRLDDFLTGMVVAEMYARRQSLDFSARSGWCFALSGIFLAWIGMALWDATVYLNVPRWCAAYYNIFLNTGFGALLWGCICLRSSSKGWPETLLQNYPLQLLGMMCYSIYIWHQIMLDLTGYHANWLSLSRYLIFTLIVSAVSYRYIEFARTRDWRELLPKKCSPT